jgi:long-chain acyl-CoA synthetase
MTALATPHATDIPQLLALLKANESRTALSFYRGKALDGRLTYAEFVSRVEELAGHLAEAKGVAPGDRVAVLAPNRLEIPVLVLALMRLGAVVVPLNPTASPEDWAYILAHSKARGLAAARDLDARVPAAARPSFTLFVEDLFQARSAPAPPSVYASFAERPAIVLYTSGTTGNPKGVTLRQRNLLANGWSMARNFGLSGTTQLAVLPLYHAHAFGFGLMTALVTGGHLVFTERLEPFTWTEVVRLESVEVTSVVPSLLPMLLAARVARSKAPTLKRILVSSAPLAVDVARDFEDKTEIPLIQGWGLSEYTNFACCMPVDVSDDEHKKLLFGWEVPSIGPALEGSEVRVVDPNRAPVGEGVRGEMQIRGHSTMLGYLDDSDATARTLDGEGWLSTGDEGFFRVHEGRPVYFISGRLKEIIIRDAEKYSPLAIERRLVEAVPELSGKLVALGFSHKMHGEEVGLYVESEAYLDGPLMARLIGAVEAMPVAERPKVIVHGGEAIPRTHTGKIQRRRMQPWFASYQEHRGPVVVARK